MNLLIFNHIYPDDSGFSNRCRVAIDNLAKYDDLIVICRTNQNISDEKIVLHGHTLTLKRYIANSQNIEIVSAYIPFVYEILKNVRLCAGLLSKLIPTLTKYTQLNIYVVSSPITLPAVVILFSKLFRKQLRCVEFHDVGPELLIELKNVSTLSLLYKLECFLERIVCSSFKYVIVTSYEQKKRILARNPTIGEKIHVIENLVKPIKRFDLRINYSKKRINILYSSSTFFSMYREGLQDFLDFLYLHRDFRKKIKLTISGENLGSNHLKNKIKLLSLFDSVEMLGKTKNDSEYSNIDLTIIPWYVSKFSKTVLPTRLFKSLSYGIPVIAPNFGTFPSVIESGKNGYLFNSFEDIKSLILLLDSKKLYKMKSHAKSMYETYYNLNNPAELYASIITGDKCYKMQSNL